MNLHFPDRWSIKGYRMSAVYQPKKLLALTVALNLTLGAGLSEAATPVIGSITANGSFHVDSLSVTGNATLFEGATVETGFSGSSLRLIGGSKVNLGSESKGRIFGDHLVIEKGRGGWDKTTGFRVEARGLTLQPETANSSAQFALEGANGVKVAALNGSLRVLNSAGVVIAKLPPGETLAFEPQAANGMARITGLLQSKGGHFVIVDETTHVTVEVTGQGLAGLSGKRIEITGTADPAAAPVSEASQLIRVSSIHPLSGPGAAAAGSTNASAGRRRTRLGGLAITGTTMAVVGGVAAAAVVGGLAGAGTFSGASGSSSGTPLSK